MNCGISEMGCADISSAVTKRAETLVELQLSGNNLLGNGIQGGNQQLVYHVNL